jgi:histidine triad (HIT) family protein
MNSAECIFCKIVTREIPAQFLFESINVIAINDITPQAPTHILIIPKWHHENAAAVAAEAPTTLAELFTVADSLATDQGLDGYRLTFNTGESAGQTVFHAHLHLLGGRPFAWPPG